MPLPEKNYCPLHEVAARWKTSLSDLHYYASHGFIEVMAWFDVKTAAAYPVDEAEGNASMSPAADLQDYKDYAFIDSDELRQIVRKNDHCIKKFLSESKRIRIQLHDGSQGYNIRADDLVISRNERDRFEVLYALMASTASNDSRSPSFPGRPSSMYQVRQCFMRRCHEGAVLPSLRQEALYLDRWASTTITDGQAPRARTIMNALREDYRKYHDQKTR